jgi:hypothetical protein
MKKYTKEESLQLIMEEKLCMNSRDCSSCYFRMSYSYTSCYIVRYFHLNHKNTIPDIIIREKLKRLKKILQ